MLAEVAAAIRGFSVYRDIFQTHVDAAKRVVESQLCSLDNIKRYAPLTTDGYWAKVLSTFVGLGIVSPVLVGLRTWAGATPWLIVTGLCFGAVLGVLGMQYVTDRIVEKRMAALHNLQPTHLKETWNQQAMEGYKRVGRQFLLKAIEIERRYFPSTGGSEGVVCATDDQMEDPRDIELMLERAFSFYRT